MKCLVEESELKVLIKNSERWNACERGGVDNWQRLEESFENYFSDYRDNDDDIDIDAAVKNIMTNYPTESGKALSCKWTEGDVCYYNDNRAEFVKQISKKYALIIVEAVPNIEATGSEFCTACMAAPAGCHPTHTCHEAQEVIDSIEAELEEHPTMVPMFVELRMLYEKPLIVDKHEKEIERLKGKKMEVESKTKKLLHINAELEAKIEANKKAVKQMENLGISSNTDYPPRSRKLFRG